MDAASIMNSVHLRIRPLELTSVAEIKYIRDSTFKHAH